MDELQLYNSVIIKSYIDYLEHAYPDMSVAEALAFAGINHYELTDRGHWLTQTQVNRFHEYIKNESSNPDIAREAGRYMGSPNASVVGVIRQLASGILSLPMAYWAVEKIASSLSRHLTLRSQALAGNKLEIVATPNKDIKEERFQCENRLGMFEAISRLYTDRYAKIEHPECIHKGGACCRYILSLDTPRSLGWRRLGYYLLGATVVAAFPLLFFLPIETWLISILSAALISTVPILYGAFSRSNEMAQVLKEQNQVSDEVIRQINLRYNESLMIHEIGVAASTILDPQQLLNFITDALHKRMQFNRSMVMLANPDRTSLIYHAGHGYTPHEEALLRNVDFSLTNPASRGFFYQAFINRKPFLIDRVSDHQDDLSEKTNRIIRELGVSAFICVPILYKGQSEGILAVDNSHTRNQTTQSDLSLLMGVAQQIGISLHTAMAHKRILESESRFRNLTDNSPDMIYQLDRQSRIRYANPAWEDILGYLPDDLAGKPLTDFLRHEDRAPFAETFQEILSNAVTIRDKNFTIYNKKGLPRFVTFSGTPDINGEGDVIGILGTLKDISKIRNMEAQLLQASKMEAVGTLTGGIAHDFNNIIQAIMGYNQLMISGRLGNETDMPYLNSIGELIARSRELVRQLLLFSKKVEPVSMLININDEIKSMRNLLAKSIPKMIEIGIDLDPDIRPIQADTTQIGQIIMNLVINARDAMGDTGKISIKTRNLVVRDKTMISGAMLTAGSYIKLSVSDTGCGIDNDVIGRIFEPFFTTKEVGKGTGLGLSVVHGIVKNQDGLIYCESEPDQGTTFTIILPASATVLTPDISTLDDHLPTTSDKRGTERILIVDDELSILETGKEALKLFGYDVITATSGEEALDAYLHQSDPIDLIILDLIMPGGGGKKCLIDIKSRNPGAKILMTSGYNSKQQTEELTRAGAIGFLHKPYRPDDLLNTIRRALDAI